MIGTLERDELELEIDELLVDPTIALRLTAQLLAPDTEKPRWKQYWYDPVGFIEAYFPKLHFTTYQREVVGKLCTERKLCVRGPHSLGKTAMFAAVVIWFALTREEMCRVEGGDWKVVTTASVARQLTKFLWPEIKKWSKHGGIAWAKLGRPPFDRRRELLETQLKLTNGEAFAASADDPANMEGAHADHLLYVIDEAKTVSDETFDAIEGAFAGAGECLAFAGSTPGEPHGRFYDIQSRKPGYEDWWVRFVTLAEAIAAGRVPQTWVDQRARQWGVESAMYQNRVLGQFAVDAEDGVIPIAWAEAAMLRAWPYAPGNAPYSCCGVDVARSGSDKTYIAPRFGRAVARLKQVMGADTMITTAEVAAQENEHRRDGYAVIDTIGIGAGVYDRLREQGYDVEPFNASSMAMTRDSTGELEFGNRRAEAWWNLRELLDPANNFNLVLPDDEELLGDLCTPKYRRSSQGGRIFVEGKDEIRKRLHRSPDKGDAVVMSFAERYPETDDQYVVYDDPVQISAY